MTEELIEAQVGVTWQLSIRSWKTLADRLPSRFLGSHSVWQPLSCPTVWPHTPLQPRLSRGRPTACCPRQLGLLCSIACQAPFHWLPFPQEAADSLLRQLEDDLHVAARTVEDATRQVRACCRPLRLWMWNKLHVVVRTVEDATYRVGLRKASALRGSTGRRRPQVAHRAGTDCSAGQLHFAGAIRTLLLTLPPPNCLPTRCRSLLCLLSWSAPQRLPPGHPACIWWAARAAFLCICVCHGNETAGRGSGACPISLACNGYNVYSRQLMALSVVVSSLVLNLFCPALNLCRRWPVCASRQWTAMRRRQPQLLSRSPSRCEQYMVYACGMLHWRKG